MIFLISLLLSLKFPLFYEIVTIVNIFDDAICPFMGFILTLVAFSGILWGRNKKTYLTFTIDDILRELHIPTKIKYMIIHLIIASIITVLASPICEIIVYKYKESLISYHYYLYSIKSVAFVAYLLFLWNFVSVLYKFSGILFENTIQYKMYDLLHRELRYNIRKKLTTKLTKNDIENTIDYLFYKFKKYDKKITQSRIINISYKSFIKEAIEPKSSIKRLTIFHYIISMTVLTFLSSVASFIDPPDNYIDLLLSFLSIVILICTIIIDSEHSTNFLTSILFDNSGYHFVTRNLFRRNILSKEYKVFRKNKYDRFLISTKNILGLFILTLDSHDENSAEDIFNYFHKISKDCNNKNGILIFMDYYWIKNNYSSSLFYNIPQETETNEKDIQLARALVYDINRKIVSGNLEEESFEKYIAKYHIT
jgi:hypothetical protein